MTSILLRSPRLGPTPAIASSVVAALLVFGASASAPSRSAAAAAAPVVTIAGDIGISGSEDNQTAALIEKIDPDYVLTAGDNAYPDGTKDDYKDNYDPSWGRFKEKTRPAPGNHDYHDEAGDPPYYYTYFADQLPAQNDGRYYAFDVGSWRLYSLNCEIDCSGDSSQVTWLKRDLETRGAGKHKLAYLHRPRYSCGKHGSSSLPDALWDALIDARADAVVAGHDHNYQRYPRMDSDGDPSRTGMLSFVAGSGGAGLYDITGDEGEEGCSLAEVTNSDTRGVLELRLGLSSLSWAFHSVDDTVLDSGTRDTLDSASVVDVALRDGADDAEERVRTGWVSLASWDLELGVNGEEAQVVGLRFRSVAVPADARIVSAYVQFQVDEVSTGRAALTVKGLDSDSAARFTATRESISSRDRTAASVAWHPPPWPEVERQGADQRTPDLSEVVQEIVDRPGWETGNALGLVITGEGRRTARSFETGPPAILHVEYRR